MPGSVNSSNIAWFKVDDEQGPNSLITGISQICGINGSGGGENGSGSRVSRSDSGSGSGSRSSGSGLPIDPLDEFVISRGRTFNLSVEYGDEGSYVCRVQQPTQSCVSNVSELHGESYLNYMVSHINPSCIQMFIIHVPPPPPKLIRILDLVNA